MCTPPPINAMRPCNDGYRSHHLAHNDTCSCPQRTVPPPCPTELPFPCVSANNNRMKAWLLDRYGSSTFNICPHQALPCMEGPPIEIHVDPAATPKACHTPATMPLHWQQKVYDDLLRDEVLGVIERVPYGEQVTLCHCMVITRKHDGSPRRTVDLSPLNKYCQRETFANESPFHLASCIPKDKTVIAYRCVNRTATAPRSSHLSAVGATQRHLKASCRLGMTTTAALTPSSPISSGKSAV